MPFILEPEVAGGWGEGTVADTSVHPPVVHELVYEFAGWLGDDLLESFPCFIVSSRLAGELSRAGLTGYRLAPVAVIKSSQFAELEPTVALPEFHWLQVTGQPGRADFWLSESHQLVASDTALSVLKHCALNECGVEPC